MARRINFFDGAESSTTPTIGNLVASNLITYADDAAYEAAEQGSPIRGNIYYNTTDEVIRYYNGTEWVTIDDEKNALTLQNKTIDGTDATGNNTVSIDATDASYDNATSGLSATDAQAAIDEVDANVDDLETLSGSPGATDHGTFTGTTIPDSSTTKGALQALETEVELKEDTTNKGVANGYASLDGGGKVPASQLPSTVMEFKGNWDANTNSPALIDGTGDAGDVYRVSVAGTQDLGSGSETYAVGDWIMYNGTIWQKGDNTDAVASVFGRTGAVTAQSNDYTWAQIDKTTSSIDDIADVETTSATDGQVLTWVNANSRWEAQDPTGGSGAISVSKQIFTSGGTWNKPANLVAVIVEVQGGGGGGGAAAGSGSGTGGGAGGGGGGYSRKVILNGALGSSETVTVGSGGTGGTGAGGNGLGGGSSSFGAHLSASPGTGGNGDAARTTAVTEGTDAPGAGGTGSSGDVNIQGEYGDYSFLFGGTPAGRGGKGGSSQFGRGGNGGVSGGGGQTALGYGGGGGGGCATNATDRSGGSGSPGIVIVTEFIQA